MKFWHSLLRSVPKFHFGTPLNCQSENEGCLYCSGVSYILCVLCVLCGY
ncbi:MAG: hypothetical protein GY795_05150 [Desulfobacterales bacterium]|nr:hypothetical protein [Desulfobacterales bacterium]